MKLITLTGASGSGKTSIVNAVQIFYNYVAKGLEIPASVPEVQKQALQYVGKIKVKPVGKIPVCKEAISYTTRKIRPGEISDVTYHYITEKEFFELKDKLEETFYDGNHYCLSSNAITETNAEIVLAIVDQNGANSIKSHYPSTTRVFLSMNPDQIRERLTQRNESEEKIESRIKKAFRSNEFIFENAEVTIDSSKSLGNALKDFINVVEKYRT